MLAKTILRILSSLFFMSLYSQENKPILKNSQQIDLNKFIALKKANPDITVISIFENGKI